jgi:hypothetical protein
VIVLTLQKRRQENAPSLPLFIVERFGEGLINMSGVGGAAFCGAKVT